MGLEDWVWPRVRGFGAAAWAILVIAISFHSLYIIFPDLFLTFFFLRKELFLTSQTKDIASFFNIYYIYYAHNNYLETYIKE